MSRKRNNPQFQPANLTTSFDPASPDYGTGRVRFSAQQAEFETINYAAELAGTIHFTDNIRNEVLLGASRVIRTLASSPNIRTFFEQNFANPVFIAEPGREYRWEERRVGKECVSRWSSGC